MAPIFLIGYMGSGKTTLGRVLAKAMNFSFIDLDWYIEGRYHKTVGELFSERGESGFREIESRLLREVGQMNDTVIAAGGGTPCFNENIDFMLSYGQVVYLKTSVNVLFDRLKTARSQRPLLRDKNDKELLAFLTETLQKRSPYYTQAHLVFDSDKLDSVKDIDLAVEKLKTLIQPKK
ncbi:MAG: shikimate kinase [Bacteroidaceae bacterium]|nr:shikimate kinase [Bacteroidaceae bacterium]